MFFCTFLVFAMCKLASSRTTVTPTTSTISALPYPAVPLNESCIAGHPLPSCWIRCNRMYKKAYCDNSTGQCKCRFEGRDRSYYEALINSPPHFPKKPTLPNYENLHSGFLPSLQAPHDSGFNQISNTEPEEDRAEDKPPSVVLFFIQLKKTFRLNLDDDADPPTPVTSSSQSFDNAEVIPGSAVLTKSEVTEESIETDGLGVPQFVCFLLVVLLCCLITAELTILYGKTKKRNSVGPVFEREPVLEKS